MIYWIWLKNIKGVGPATQRKLISIFGSPKKVYDAKKDEIIDSGLSKKIAELVTIDKSLNAAEKELEECKRLGIKIVCMNDDMFPKRMIGISDLPVLLYYKGNLFEPETTAGVVGPRRCTQETKEKVIDIANECVSQGKIIVSGLARGVDGYSHTAAIKCGCKTIAVTGCGLDICYPKEHEKLFGIISEAGLVLSEYGPGEPALYYHFPKRNRIIAALSDTLYVVDAGRNSGALITKEYAEKYGKKVFIPFLMI